MNYIKDWIELLVKESDNPSVKGKIRKAVIDMGISQGTYYNILNNQIRRGVQEIHYSAFLSAFQVYKPDLTLNDIKNPVPVMA